MAVSRKGQGQLPIRHGTRAGYAQELYRGLPTCGECRKAAAEHQREYKRSRRTPDQERQRGGEDGG